MLVARTEGCTLHQWSTYRNTERLHGNWNWIFSCSMGDGEVSSLLVHKPFYPWNRSKTIGSHPIKKPKPSNTKAAKNPNQNIPLQHYSSLYMRCDKSTCRLLVSNGWPELPKLHVYQITQQFSARSDSLHQLRLSMQADDELAWLKDTIMQRWSKSIKQVPPVLQPFWTFR